MYSQKKIQLLWGRFFSLPFGVGWGGVGKRSTIVLFEHHRSVSTPSFFYSTIVLFEHHRSVWISSFCLSTIVLFEHHRSVWVSSFCLSTIVLLEHHRSVWAPSFCWSTIVLSGHDPQKRFCNENLNRMIPRQNVEFTKKTSKTQGFGVQQSFYLESFYQNFGSWRSFGGSGGNPNRMIPKQNAGFRICGYGSKLKNWVTTDIGLGLVLSIHVLGYLILTRPHVL